MSKIESSKEYIAADIGASNGRVILGRFDGQRLDLKEASRFSNEYICVDDAYYWDVLGLYSNIVKGIGIIAKAGHELSGVGIDTWGVDFGFVDRQGRLTGNPRAYRDPAWRTGFKEFQRKYGKRTLFDMTGVANLEFNTVYQLYSMVLLKDPQLNIAHRMLLLPDLLGYMLCGEMSSEYTHATTTQMLDSKTGNWSEEISGMIGMPENLLASIKMSGTVKGILYDIIKEETGLKSATPVYCVGSHDTASAVASVPAKNENYAFLSSGTWSLIGIISDEAVINDTVYKNNFSNEGTVDGKYRILRNIMGLWIIQNCKKQWDREESLSWDDIITLAGDAPAFKSFIDVNDNMFFDGSDMAGKIRNCCEATGQPVPCTKGEVARAVYESLAMSYREAFLGLEQLKGKSIDVLHIVGGGSKNGMLNQLAANAVGREVIAGPVEATAIGNIMVQIRASGEITGISEMRQVIRESFEVESYEPQNTDVWAEQFERYMKMKEGRK